jgi:CHAD domain-containing protein
VTPKGNDTLGEQFQAQAKRECRTIRRKLVAKRHLHGAVHEARKAVRRLRALVELIDDRIEDAAHADRALERLGDSLSTLRDASVVIEAAEKLAKHHPGPVWKTITTRLHDRCEKIIAQTLQDDPNFNRRLALLVCVEARMAAWPWDELRRKDLESSLRASQRRVEKARRRATESNESEDLHRWRRRSRKLRMQLEVVGKADAHIANKASTSTSRHQIRALRRLSDKLGWHQDLVVLRNLIRRMRGLDGRDTALAAISREMVSNS